MRKSKVHTFSAMDDVMKMLDLISRYHQSTKSASISALIKKEFWRLFPQGTQSIKPMRGVRVEKASRKR